MLVLCVCFLVLFPLGAGGQAESFPSEPLGIRTTIWSYTEQHVNLKPEAWANDSL